MALPPRRICRGLLVYLLRVIQVSYIEAARERPSGGVFRISDLELIRGSF